MLSARRFGARLRQAVINASRTAPFLAARNRTFVAPPRPHPALDRREDRGLGSDEQLLLLGSELHHPPPAAGIAQRRENPAAHAKVRVPHVSGFGGLRQTQGYASELMGRHQEISCESVPGTARARSPSRPSRCSFPAPCSPSFFFSSRATRPPTGSSRSRIRSSHRWTSRRGCSPVTCASAT